MSDSFPAALSDRNWSSSLSSFGRKGVERLSESEDSISFQHNG